MWISVTLVFVKAGCVTEVFVAPKSYHLWTALLGKSESVWYAALYVAVFLPLPSHPRLISCVELVFSASFLGRYLWEVSTQCFTPKHINKRLCLLVGRLDGWLNGRSVDNTFLLRFTRRACLSAIFSGLFTRFCLFPALIGLTRSFFNRDWYACRMSLLFSMFLDLSCI